MIEVLQAQSVIVTQVGDTHVLQIDSGKKQIRVEFNKDAWAKLAMAALWFKNKEKTNV
jgi:hypothetical protein